MMNARNAAKRTATPPAVNLWRRLKKCRARDRVGLPRASAPLESCEGPFAMAGWHGTGLRCRCCPCNGQCSFRKFRRAAPNVHHPKRLPDAST
jgi:hypothetical protein